MKFNGFNVGVILFLVSLILSVPSRALAVVGYAEKFDQFEEEDLQEFHQFLLDERELAARQASIKETTEFLERYQGQEETVAATTPIVTAEGETIFVSGQVHDEEKDDEKLDTHFQGKPQDAYVEEIRRLMVALPKKKLFTFRLNGSYDYTYNYERVRKRKEWNGNSVYEADASFEVNISGKKTDLRYETIVGKVWNHPASENDFYDIEQQLRYGRKYFKKMRHNAQLSVNRNTSKTIEIDSNTNKIRYDIQTRNNFNWALTKKIGLSATVDWNRRLFLDEQFDQDSQRDVQINSGVNWNLTPKSRVSLNYGFGAGRARSKAGDSNSHDLGISYFGKLGRKTSFSSSIEYEKQTPRSNETNRVQGVRVSLGLLWQLTRKTGFGLQFSRKVQNTSSDSADNAADENATIRTDSHFTNNQVNLSLNSRVTKKLSISSSIGARRSETDVFKDGDESSRSSEWAWPFKFSLRYAFTRWFNMNLGYNFDWSRAKSDAGSYKDHNLLLSMQLVV